MAMNIPSHQIRTDGQRLARALDKAESTSPKALEKTLTAVLDQRADAPEVRTERKVRVLAWIDAHKGELSDVARSNLESLQSKLQTVSLADFKAAMKAAPSSGLLRALRLAPRAAYVRCDERGPTKVIQNPVPKDEDRFDESKRATFEVSFKAGRLIDAEGKTVKHSSVRLILRDDGKLYALKPDRYSGVGEWNIGEDHAVATVGASLDGGRITGFRQQYKAGTGVQFESDRTNIALLFMRLEEMGMKKVGNLEFTDIWKFHWEGSTNSVDDYLRSFVRPPGEGSAFKTQLADLCRAREDKKGSPVGKTQSKIAVPELKLGRKRNLRADPKLVPWKFHEQILATGDSRATVPTLSGDLQVDYSDKKLQIVGQDGLRPPTKDEKLALAQTLAQAVGAWSADLEIIVPTIAALEGTGGPVRCPPALAQGTNEVPSGLRDAHFIDPDYDLNTLQLLLPKQDGYTNAWDFATGLKRRESGRGLGELSPDGKSQWITGGSYSEQRTLESMIALANATGRTMWATYLDHPIHCNPGDKMYTLKNRCDGFRRSMGHMHYDSALDARRSLARRSPSKIEDGKVLEHVRKFRGDERLTGFALISDPDNMMEFMLHLRDQVPPQALMHIVAECVSGDQIIKGTGQAWVDTMNKVLLG